MIKYVLIASLILTTPDISLGFQASDGLPGDQVTLETSDGLKIAATIGGLDENIVKPGLVLIHQGGSSRSEWRDFFERAIAANYVVLAYDVRGHGQSAPVKDIYTLFNDPQLAPLDLKAAIQYLKYQKSVDADRVGVVGASIGANLAAVAAGSEQYTIKTAVAISGKTSAVYNLAGVKEGSGTIHFKSVFYIASEKEQEGARAKWAQELYDQTTEPRMLEITLGSDKHGVHIMEDDPELANRIFQWLDKTL